MTWLDGLVPHLKALHLGLIAIWVAGLIALPHMLARHDRAIVQAEFARIRRATHYGYVWVVTPAAVLAIASGAALVFLRDVFTGWIFAKVVLVSGLVALHAWVGHTIIHVAETEGRHEPPGPVLPALATGVLVIGILCLVLAKPALDWIDWPDWMLAPRGRQVPFDVPR
jgi:putative membrane protein